MSRILFAVLLALLAAACAGPPPVPDDRRTVEERVRAPAAGSGNEELQVYGLRNPAVASLDRQAEAAEQAGNLERAAQLLERALRIDGRDPEILQRMAEVQLQRGDLDQAEHYATRADELGPRVGQICQRTLRTLIVVHERNQNFDRAARARARLDECRVAPPERF